MKIRDLFYSFCRRKIGDGKKTRFWEDPWVTNIPFSLKFMNLYSICETIEVTVHQVFTSRWQILKFRRTLSGETLQMWEELKNVCADVSLRDHPDTLIWKLDPKGFSVRSVYRTLKMGTLAYPFKGVWKFKIPAKVKVFLWLAIRNSILTKNVLHRRGWEGVGCVNSVVLMRQLHIFSSSVP